MERRKTKKQHYIQKALVKLWSQDGYVNVARVNPDHTLRKEKDKSPGSIFFDYFIYEQIYGFSSAERHLQLGTIVYTDEKHVFKMNDGELYCKTIEDAGFPVIRDIISAVCSGDSTLLLSDFEKENLCRYLVLQALRTPGGRKNYQIDYSPRVISEDSSAEEVLDNYIDNLTYLFCIGTYDDMGLSDEYEMPESIFQHLFGIVKDMKGYALYVKKNRKNFIMGDNPCVFMGIGDGISAVLMPFSPNILFLLIAEEGCENSEAITICPCQKEWFEFEYYCEMEAAQNRIIYDAKSTTLDDISDIYAKCNGTIMGMEIWTLKKMIDHLQIYNSGFTLEKHINKI